MVSTKVTKPNDPIVLRIDKVLRHPDRVDRDDLPALESIRRSILHFPEHEETNSMAVLHSLAEERLRRVNESSIEEEI